MIVTLYLISANVCNSVDAPHSKGFSYIEIWMIGTQIPILLALCEYGLILHWRKISKKSTDKHGINENQDDQKADINDRFKMIDYASMILSFLYFIMFATIYWIGNPFKNFH